MGKLSRAPPATLRKSGEENMKARVADLWTAQVLRSWLDVIPSEGGAANGGLSGILPPSNWRFQTLGAANRNKFPESLSWSPIQSVTHLCDDY